MIKLSKRQQNALIDALGNLFLAEMKLEIEGDVDSLNDYHQKDQYTQGVLDALSLRAASDAVGYRERYHIYPAEVCNATLDDNGNSIEILTIDAAERKIIYNIFEGTDYYSLKYSKWLEKGLRDHYKKVYNEEM